MQPSLSPAERQDRIVALAGERRRLPVAGLAETFATSEDSIRRDLRALAAAGRIRRLHGLVLPAAPAEPFDVRGERMTAEKQAIGRAAARLLKAGDTVFIDGGTTALAAARALPADLALTVATPSPPVAMALVDHPAVAVILLGGSFDKPSRTVVGSATLAAVGAIQADVVLLGLCGLDPSGVSATGYEEAAVKRAMADRSRRVIALATADKLGTLSPHHVMAADRLDDLVTAEGPEDLLDAFQKIGVAIHRADP